MANPSEQAQGQEKIRLKRELTLPLVVFYGLGVTVGAGIYVLVGLTAAKAGVYAPVSFLIAAFVTAFTAISYSELSTRMPVSAGEAAYVLAGFNSSKLSLFVGLLVALSGIISSATVSIGAASYLQHFITMPQAVMLIVIVLLLGLIAVWGIFESIVLASLFTLIEIGGLFLVIYFGISSSSDFANNLHLLVPPMELSPWTGIFAATLLAFFAFIGFEDIANVAEEVKTPRTTMPRAIILTLIFSTLIYLAVVSVVVLVVPMEKLIGSTAPLALVFESSGDKTSSMFNAIAVFATLNGVLIQMIMASRILYGLSCQDVLPKILSEVHPVTRTPLNATVLVVLAILFLALFLPIDALAKYTSVAVLIVFIFINLALILIKRKKEPVDSDYFEAPTWCPYIGFLSCVILLLAGLI